MKSFGESLKKSRESKGLTQRYIAKKLYVDPSLVCRWEKGQRQIMPDEMIAISEILEMSLDEFKNM